MKMGIGIVMFALVTWGLAWLAPGVDPYAVVTLVLATSGRFWTLGIGIVAFLGLCGEALAMQPLGRFVGPLLLLLGIMQWTRERFIVHDLGTLAAWLVCGSLAYHCGLMAWETGRVPLTMALGGRIAATAGFAAIGAVAHRWWCGTLPRLGRRTKIRI